MYEARMPDMLHELAKGVFSHIVGFWHEMMSNRALKAYDKRFLALPGYPGMKRFTKALTALSQLSGADMREIMRVDMTTVIKVYITCQ